MRYRTKNSNSSQLNPWLSYKNGYRNGHLNFMLIRSTHQNYHLHVLKITNMLNCYCSVHVCLFVCHVFVILLIYMIGMNTTEREKVKAGKGGGVIIIIYHSFTPQSTRRVEQHDDVGSSGGEGEGHQGWDYCFI